MAILGLILWQTIIPLFVLIGIGVLFQKAFRPDIRTLSKLIFYVLTPVITFQKLYESELTMAVLGEILLFFCMFYVLLIIVAEAVIRIRGYKPSKRSAFRNSALFYNSANYGVPLNLLVFQQSPVALSVQIMIMTIQNIIPNTYGVYSVNAHKQAWKETAKVILTIPTIYMIPLAFILRAGDVPIPASLYIPMNYISEGFIPVALITLGIQLGSMKVKFQALDVALSGCIRLLAAPVLGFLVVFMLGLEGIVAKALILSCAVPTSLSSVLLAIEFDNEKEFASQTVLASTILSIVTITVVVYLLRYIPG